MVNYATSFSNLKAGDGGSSKKAEELDCTVTWRDGSAYRVMMIIGFVKTTAYLVESLFMTVKYRVTGMSKEL